MIIQISKELRIRGTKYCWQLEALRQYKGKDEWRAFKWHSTIDSALREAAQREIRLNSATDLTDAIEAVEQIGAKYARIFDGVPSDVKSRTVA